MRPISLDFAYKLTTGVNHVYASSLEAMIIAVVMTLAMDRVACTNPRKAIFCEWLRDLELLASTTSLLSIGNFQQNIDYLDQDSAEEYF